MSGRSVRREQRTRRSSWTSTTPSARSTRSSTGTSSSTWGACAYHNRTGSPEKALEHAHKALELNHRSDRAWFHRARAEDSLGRPAEAVDALNQAISLNPRASSYYYVLARLYRRLGRKEESQEALATFKRLERETEELQKKRREETRGNQMATGSDG